MSDRELRDEIETLYSELKQARAQLEAPAGTEAEWRSELEQEIAQLKERKRVLTAHLEGVEKGLRTRKREISEAKSELSDARAKIAERQPLGNAYADNKSNWELEPRTDINLGCSGGLFLFFGAALSLAAWWMR